MLELAVIVVVLMLLVGRHPTFKAFVVQCLLFVLYIGTALMVVAVFGIGKML